ncbi:MAG: hypothetical protein EBX70_08755, partial [Betaproteobacteria bacterium]|nr:hypothetical protein [Betaproteobacteria bacterium]
LKDDCTRKDNAIPNPLKSVCASFCSRRKRKSFLVPGTLVLSTYAPAHGDTGCTAVAWFYGLRCFYRCEALGHDACVKCKPLVILMRDKRLAFG